MIILRLEREPLATQVRVTDENLIVDLMDGRSLTVPLSWYPRLRHASHEERQNWQLLGEGCAIEWIDLDEHTLFVICHLLLTGNWSLVTD
jgi:hypothetical protein